MQTRRHASPAVRIAKYAALGAAALVLALLALVRPDLPPQELVAQYGGPPSRFVTVAGVNVHYRDQGQGPVLVLLHGLNASLHTWEGWVAELSRDHRVISVDLPGHGLTGPRPDGRYATADMVAFVDALVRTLGVARFSLAGNSMGGGIAWRYALLHPDRVDKLILVDAVGYPREESPPLVLRLASVPGLGRLMALCTPRFLVAASLRQVYGDPARVTEPLVTRYYDLLRRQGNRGATRAILLSLWSEDAAAEIPRVRAPTLILWGSKDTWILPKYGAYFRRDLPHATLRVYEGLGHTPMEEDPAATARDVRAFLQGG